MNLIDECLNRQPSPSPSPSPSPATGRTLRRVAWRYSPTGAIVLRSIEPASVGDAAEINGRIVTIASSEARILSGVACWDCETLPPPSIEDRRAASAATFAALCRVADADADADAWRDRAARAADAARAEALAAGEGEAAALARAKTAHELAARGASVSDLASAALGPAALLAPSAPAPTIAIGGNTKATLVEGLRADCDKAPATGSWHSRPDGKKVGEVEGAAADRIARDRAAAAAAGILLPEPAYAAGSRLNEAGIERATQAEIAHEARPLASEALAALEDTIANEKRRSIVAPWAAIALDDDGRASVRGEKLAIERGAWADLAADAGLGSGARLLARGTAGLRAHAWRELARTDGEARLLVREAGGVGGIWGSVGSRYPDADGDRAARILAGALRETNDTDARARIDYDGRGWRVEISRHTPIRGAEMGAGEIVRAALIVTSHDAGGGSLRIAPALVQNSCLNLIILDQAMGAGSTLAHRGSVSRLLRDLREGILGARAAVAAFWDRWCAASRVRVDEPEGVIRAVVANRRVDLGKRRAVERADEVIQALHEGLAEKTVASAIGPSRAAIADAFTRWAHQRGGMTLEVADLDEIRRQAASIAIGGPLPLPMSRSEMAAALGS